MSFLTRQMTSKVPRIATRAFSTSRPSQLARITVVGRLGAEPEVVETAKGTTLVRYVVGTSQGPKDNKTTSWFRVTSFADGAQRDFITGLPKGTLVYLEGDASFRPYEDAEGRKQNPLNIVQTKLDVLQRPRVEAAESSEE